MSAPVPAPIAAPAIVVEPALPPETAEPTRAPVAAPSVPPTNAFCCWGVWQAETETAAASASESAKNLFIESSRPSCVTLVEGPVNRGGALEGRPDPIKRVRLQRTQSPHKARRVFFAPGQSTGAKGRLRGARACRPIRSGSLTSRSKIVYRAAR